MVLGFTLLPRITLGQPSCCTAIDILRSLDPSKRHIKCTKIVDYVRATSLISRYSLVWANFVLIYTSK